MIWENGKPSKGAFEIKDYVLVPLTELPLKIDGPTGGDMLVDGRGIIWDNSLIPPHLSPDRKVKRKKVEYRQLFLRWMQYEKRGIDEYGEIRFQTTPDEISNLFKETEKDNWEEVSVSTIMEKYSTFFINSDGQCSPRVILEALDKDIENGEGGLLELVHTFANDGYHFFGIDTGEAVDSIMFESLSDIIGGIKKDGRREKVMISNMICDVAERINGKLNQ